MYCVIAFLLDRRAPSWGGFCLFHERAEADTTASLPLSRAPRRAGHFACSRTCLPKVGACADQSAAAAAARPPGPAVATTSSKPCTAWPSRTAAPATRTSTPPRARSSPASSARLTPPLVWSSRLRRPVGWDVVESEPELGEGRDPPGRTHRAGLPARGRARPAELAGRGRATSRCRPTSTSASATWRPGWRTPSRSGPAVAAYQPQDDVRVLLDPAGHPVLPLRRRAARRRRPARPGGRGPEGVEYPEHLAYAHPPSLSAPGGGRLAR